MDLSLSKEIKNTKKDNMEITEFINELSASLENRKEINANSNLYIEILEDVELAPKYRNILQDVIDKCLEHMSYERDFFYFDLDKKTKKYKMSYYNNGNKEDVELTNDEIQKYKDYGITFYEPIDNNGGIVESDSLKDWMKCEVDIELLDIKNKT